MKKLLRYLLIGLAVLAATFVIGGFLLPAEFGTEVEVETDAPLAQMFALANDPRTWVEWSAWNTESMPDMQSSYTGPDAGVGARWTWQQEMGDGWLEITQSVENERIGYALVFADPDKPWGGDMVFSESGGKTNVRWGFSGDVGNNLMWRWMQLVMGDAMEEEYRKGVLGLAVAARELAAAAPPPPAQDSPPGEQPATDAADEEARGPAEEPAATPSDAG